MLDLVIFLYVFWQAFKSLGSTPSKQFRSLLLRILLIAALSGFFLITQLTGLIKTSFETVTAQSGIMITLASVVTALLLLMQLRSKVLDRLDELISKKHHPATCLVIALSRGLVMSGLLIAILKHFPLGLFDDLLAGSIFAGWLS